MPPREGADQLPFRRHGAKFRPSSPLGHAVVTRHQNQIIDRRKGAQLAQDEPPKPGPDHAGQQLDNHSAAHHMSANSNYGNAAASNCDLAFNTATTHASPTRGSTTDAATLLAETRYSDSQS